MNAGFPCGWCARAAAPPRSRSQYHSANAITFVAQITPPVASSPVALLANSLLLVRMSWNRWMAASRFATVRKAITVPVTIRSQVFCWSMRPGSPMISAASNPSSTAGTTQAGSTRYFAGSATCRNPATTIASATGHQCSPRAAWTGVAGAAAAGFRPDVIPHCACFSRSPSARAPPLSRQARPCLS